jgi:hypothetical protein
VVTHHCFFDGDIDVLFGANTKNSNEIFSIIFWSIEFSLLEELEAMTTKIKI